MTRNVSIWWLWPPKSQEWKLQVEGEGTFTWKAGEESCWWQWHRGCDSILFQPYTFSARTDVSTRASGLIIVPRRKCVCVCVCFRLFSCFFGQYANVLNMNLTKKPFLFCQVLFVWNLESWSRTLLRKSVVILVLWLKQNSDSSVNLPCVCAADSCANVCCVSAT